MLEIQNLCAGYGRRQVLHDISVTCPTGELTVIVGPNGSGKSTLLKAACHLIKPTAGTVTVNGDAVAALSTQERARRIAYTPQEKPIPEMTVEQLVLHGRYAWLSHPQGYRDADRAVVAAVLQRLELSDIAHQSVATLSGGLRQMAYIAMALAQDTPYLLLDEPTAHLDIAHGLQVMDALKSLAADGKGIVTVLHDLPLAMTYADRMVVLHEGRLAASGTSQEVYESSVADVVFGVHIRKHGTAYWCER